MPPKECFILMPFKKEMLVVYNEAIKPACEAAGYESLRVDELKGPYNIHRNIISHIFNSDAIIADLTEWNPNVFYEMGVAHTIDNKTIMISQQKDKPPFDVSTYTCILYEQTPEGLAELQKNIIDFLNSIHIWHLHPTNPVQDFKPHEALVPRATVQILEKQLADVQEIMKTMIPQNKFRQLEAEIDNLKNELASRPTIDTYIGLTAKVTTLQNQLQEKEKQLKDKDIQIKFLLDEADKKKPTQTKIITPPGMVLIPAGEFMMGTTDQEFEKYAKENKDWKNFLEWERPVHKVYLDNFFIDQYLITNTQYAEFLNEWGKDTDESGQKMIEEYKWGVHKVKDRWEPQKGFEKHPVVYVTWFGANQFAKWAQKQLPAEAQWEKAARGGNGLEYATQTGAISHELANYDSKIGKTTPVGQYPPNPFNLFDMSGNVWEWCLDRFDEQYYQSCAKQSVTKNPTGPEKGKARVLRGGSWGNDPIFLRAADRDGCNPTYGSSDFGFRCSRA